MISSLVEFLCMESRIEGCKSRLVKRDRSRVRETKTPKATVPPKLEAEKMAEIRKTLPEMLFSQYSSRHGSLATEQMQREKERLSRECSAGEGEIKGLLSTVSGLKEKGMTVARRTIAKYRGILKIAPSHQRRRV